jgi:hypothetical protein
MLGHATFSKGFRSTPFLITPNARGLGHVDDDDVECQIMAFWKIGLEAYLVFPRLEIVESRS